MRGTDETLCEYEVETAAGHVRRFRGHRVGDFAVRVLDESATALGPNGEAQRFRQGDFGVDHIPSRSMLAMFDDEEQAWFMADEAAVALDGLRTVDEVARACHPFNTWWQEQWSREPHERVKYRHWLRAQREQRK